VASAAVGAVTSPRANGRMGGKALAIGHRGAGVTDGVVAGNVAAGEGDGAASEAGYL
jgi:hypothetical protein